MPEDFILTASRRRKSAICRELFAELAYGLLRPAFVAFLIVYTHNKIAYEYNMPRLEYSTALTGVLSLRGLYRYVFKK
jgi:hypothetical protein